MATESTVSRSQQATGSNPANLVRNTLSPTNIRSRSDIECSNGIIHAIDTVVLPQN
jgi:uncharacterized surface protein with fasciclin (FAS1) repeats